MCGRRDDAMLAGDMIEAATRMIAYAAGMTGDPLGEDREKADAILFNLAVLGEAAKSMSRETVSRCDAVPWSEMAMTRDKVIHHYHGIDWATVDDIVENKLPGLLPELDLLRDELSAEEKPPGQPRTSLPARGSHMTAEVDPPPSQAV